jgi:fatty acyl-CoA reductase
MTFTVADIYRFKMSDISLEETTAGVQEFFAGRAVFITGGTGFLGAVLLEKLLRACPQIGTVYLLVRPKKVTDIRERVNALFDSPVSEILTRLKILP